MKRPRSYEEDLDDDVCDKVIFKDRQSSHHRRFYLNAESSRKGGSSSSSYDRSFDDDRESSRALRRRFEHETDGFDRRKVGYDRSDHPMQLSSSPRGGPYGGERLHRSESFSALRREIPKGFRSERRDRSRREGSSGGSSWRRSSSGRESADEEIRSPSALDNYSDSVGRGGNHYQDGRGIVMSRDFSSGEQSRRGVETVKKEEKLPRESCSSSEMEEGELEPDPEPEPTSEHSPPENGKDRKAECNNVSEASSEKEEILSVRKKESDDGGSCGGKEEERSPDMDQVDGNDEVKELIDQRTQRESKGEGADINDGEDEGNKGGGKKEIPEPESQGEECVVEEDKGTAVSASLPPATNLEEKHGDGRELVADVEASGKKEGTSIDHHVDVEKKEGRGIDLEAEPEDTNGLFNSSKEEVVVVDNNRDEATLKLMTNKPQDNHKDKGKSVAISLSNKEESVDDEDAVEGPSGRRGFELLFPSDAKANCGGIVIGTHKDDKLKLEPLDLSLGLPGILSDHTSKHPDPKPSSPGHARSIRSLPSSFRTNSDGFTTSISFSSSQPFIHNPSCSLTQNSLDNYEQSVGSHPIFQGVDQISNSTTIWQAQTSNEPKWKGGASPLFQRIHLNGNPPHNSLQAQNGHHHPKPNGLSRQSSFSRQLSPTHSHGSRDTRSEHSKDKRLLTRERSNSSLYRSEHQEGEQLVLNGVSFERIFSTIVSEPLQVGGRVLQELTDHSLAYLKESICEMVTNAEKRGKIHALQEVLQRRSDLTTETMSKCPRTLLEILVVIKTGVPDFLQKSNNNIPSSDLVEIFLNLKCRNLACRSILPVDDCDCKVCIRKSGFCSACMCLVCSRFDTASNTCSWVGCDGCLHWCHTDCGLRDSHIRNGPSSSGTQGMTEMQFHCIACNHPSEMFGFVKDVFKTCAEGWKAETLAKELQYVRRIFSASNDVKGKKLCDVADQMLVKLEDKATLSEVINYIVGFFSGKNSQFIMPPRARTEKDLDIGWQHGKMVNNDHRHVKCNYCEKEMHGGVTRLKEHLASIIGDVQSCREVPREVREEMKTHIISKRKNKQATKIQKQRIQEELMNMPESENSDDDSDNEDDEHRELRRVMRASRQSFMEEEIYRSNTSGGAGPSSAVGHRPTMLSGRSKSVRQQGEGDYGRGLGGRSSSVRPQYTATDFEPRAVGPIDSFMQKKQGKAQSNIRTAMKGIKDAKKFIGRAISKFLYYNHIPFNVANSPYYHNMVDSIGEVGRGVKPPTPWEISNTYLDLEIEETQKYIDTFHKYWDEFGCTIMCDGWSTQNRRKIINFLVYSSYGTIFLKSVDATDKFQNAQYIFELMNSVVEQIGEERVAQVVTDNGTNYKAAGKLLMEARKHLYWTPYAAHCIDLIFLDMSKVDQVKNIISQCQKLTGFIYNHGWVLSLMRRETKNKELIRPAITRFATHFIALDSIYTYRDDLRRMITSRDWSEKFPKLKPNDRKTANEVYQMIHGDNFWRDIASIIAVFEPLVKVLRMVDSDDKAEMGYLYEAMDRAKEAIKKNVRKDYKRWWQIIDKRWDKQLHQDIHAAGYFLNPRYQYSTKVTNDNEVLSGFRHVVNRLEPNVREQVTIDKEAERYRMGIGVFSTAKAQAAIKQVTPESESNSSKPSIFPPKEPSRNHAEGSNGLACPSKEATWLPSFSSDEVSRLKNTDVLFSMDCDRAGRQTRDAELQRNPEKKPVVDELESVVRFKQAEAKMYQERADSARREAEGLKRIAVAKNVKNEEDYACRIAKLGLGEAEERRRQKLEELRVIERAHREYFNMKMRMEASINDLLSKMEASKRNFNT